MSAEKKRKMENVESIMMKIRDEVTDILSTRVPEESVLFNLVYLVDHMSDDPDILSAVFVCHRDRAADMLNNSHSGELFAILVNLLNIRAYYSKDSGNTDPEEGGIERFEKSGVILLTLNRQSNNCTKRVVFHRPLHCPPPVRCETVLLTEEDLPEDVLETIHDNEEDWDAQQKVILEASSE